MPNDMSHVIVPKSDQINADDLLACSMTITITRVQVKSGQEQPVSIYFEGSDKAFRPCKSMARVIVAAWGADSSKYVGRSMTLYCDPKVRWGGMEVGGIRISHMSHIDASMTMALTVTRANRKPFTVRRLETKASAAQVKGESAPEDALQPGQPEPSDAPEFITADQALTLETRCTENGIDPARLKKAAKVERISLIHSENYDKAMGWISTAIETAKKARDQK